MPALMPQSTAAIAKMKMLQMVSLNELSPKLIEFLTAEQMPVSEATLAQIDTVLSFFSKQLGQSLYFGEECFSLADIVLGVTLSMLHRLGLSLKAYPAIEDWCSRLCARQSWRLTQPSDEDFDKFKRFVQIQVQRRNQELRRQLAMH
jgi:glutathione S-transferase